MRKFILFILLFYLPFLGVSQNLDADFDGIVNQLISQRTVNYDTLHFHLKPYEKDTVKMKILVQKSAIIDYKEGESYGLHGIGGYLVNRSLFEKAIPFHEKGLHLAIESENDILQILHLNKLGAAHRRTAKIRAAIDYYKESMKIAENIQNPSYEMSVNLGRTLNSMGSAHMILQQYSKSISYYEKAIKIHDSLGYKLGLAINNQNIGNAKEELGNLDEAFEYYERSLSYNEEINSDLGRVICKNSMGRIYIKKGEYVKAETIIKPLIPIIRQTEDKFHIASVLINYGWASLKLNNLKVAELYLTEGLEISKDYGLQYSLVEAYELLSDLEISKGDNKKAMGFYKKSVRQNKKVINDQNIGYLNDLTEQYNIEKKDKEILAQQLALEQSESKTRTMGILIVSLLLAGALLWVLFQQRQKRIEQQLVTIQREQEVRTLESLMLGEEKERFRIAKELHDGVNGDLAAIKFKLTSLLETNNQVINEAVAMLDTSSEQVRAISHNLVPPSLRDFNLLEAVEAYCENMNAIHEPEIIFQHLGNAIVLGKKQEANLFRVIQELVTNSIKHAEAKEIHVQLSNIEGNLQLTVEDDGKGFDAANIKSDGIGMQNIRSRVEYLGGVMDIKSDAKGTSFTITITDKSEKA